MSEPGLSRLFDAEAIRQGVTELAQKLERDWKEKDPILVAPLDGSVIFLADLVRQLSWLVRYDFIRVEYTDRGDAPREIHFPLPTDLAGASVILLKDVMRSGITEAYLRTQLKDKGAIDMRIAALVDMPNDRAIAIEPDYRIFSVEEAFQIVGYGLKYKGRWGNRPDLYRLGPDS